MGEQPMSAPTTQGRRLLDEPVEIAVVDYGMGNRRSVEKALEHVGATATITSDHDRLRAAAGLVVPGVGAFPKGMQRLQEQGLDELLRELVAAGKPVLGVCLGMQLAFERSSELGGAAGLGIIAGEVRELTAASIGERIATAGRSEDEAAAKTSPVEARAGALKLPHIGWNEVTLRGSSPLLEGLPARCAFYHVHSFAPVPAHDNDVLGTSTYGEPFVSIVAHGSLYGVQFHPEKSSAAGLRLLANFGRICARAPVAS
jgi:imidazole glycerol-phosphate synthase subunit HisH